jgi:O-antigen biosynthesis protein WbqP
MYQAFGKRLFDLVSAIVLIALLSPVLLLTALAIWLDDRGAVIFRQTRVGKHGSDFRIYKFRSMPVNTPNVESRNASQLKVTRVGAFIRRTSIDELPQLFNVIEGSMSLVGPRPSLPTQTTVNQLRSQQGIAHLSPGVTGLAQVRASDGISDQDKVALDAQYAQQITFWFDCCIMFATVGYLFRKPPVY